MEGLIPLARPDIGPDEEAEVIEVLRAGRLALGPKTLEFERLVASFTGASWAAAVSSGTAGLHLAMHAMGVSPDDRVVTSSFSFIASANAITYTGALPVFVDIDPATLCISVDAVRDYLESCKHSDDGLRDPATGGRVVAIEPVDVFGHPAPLEEIRSLARPWEIRLIADSCESLGSRVERSDGSVVHAGADADAAVLAFYPNKQVTTGEGGMVVGSDPGLEEKIRSLRNQGRRPDDPWLHHTRLGFNYRMSELQSAVGVAQMRRVDRILMKREAVFEAFSRELEGIDELARPSAASRTRPAWFVMALRVADGVDRDRLVEHCNREGIESKAYFEPPIHRQPPYADRPELVPAPLAQTEEASKRTLIVPFFTTMTEEQVRRVADVLRTGLTRGRAA